LGANNIASNNLSLGTNMQRFGSNQFGVGSNSFNGTGPLSPANNNNPLTSTGRTNSNIILLPP
jgi:hypothetical protein